jgi:hypothetical protein
MATKTPATVAWTPEPVMLNHTPIPNSILYHSELYFKGICQKSITLITVQRFPT